MAANAVEPAPVDLLTVPLSIFDEIIAKKTTAADAQSSLRAYFRAAWPIVEPGVPLVHGWYLDALTDHLEAVERGQIRHLLITMPPRFLKSTTTTIVFPTWVWTRRPGVRFLTASHNGALAVEHAVLSRRIIDSEWYRRYFGSSVQLTTDQNIKSHYENTARGYRMAMSVGGGATGHGGDILICDDLVDLQQRNSDAVRKEAIDWRQKVWSSRANDPKKAAFIDVQQRMHTKDVAGALLERGGVEHLNLPQEYNPKRMIVTTVGTKDPRATPGELLCEERFGATENEQARKDLGSDYNAIQNQDPLPEGGKLFKRDWFEGKILTREDMARLTIVARCRGWDAAGTDDDGDYTAGVLTAKTNDGRYIIEHVIRGQWGPAAADRHMKATVEMDGRAVRQREEQEPGSAGKKVIASHLVLLAGYDYKGEPSSGDKVTRARPLRAQAQGGNVYLLAGEWNRDFLDELCAFPDGDHDDQVDGASNAFNELATGPRPARMIPLTGF